MSYQEAIEDKIPRKSLRNGMWAYLPPCHVCGKPAYSWNYIRAIITPARHADSENTLFRKKCAHEFTFIHLNSLVCTIEV